MCPPLPRFRIETVAPWTVTSVDAAGPFAFKNDGGEIIPAYILLFCCPVTRAVRLELVPNLSTERFLLALRKFYNRNSTVTEFFSDNASSFKKAAEEIKFLFQAASSEATQNFLGQKGLTWRWNVARAPWRNGHTERLFGVLKPPLRKIIGQNVLPFAEFDCVLSDLEKIINDRPLTTVSTDPNEPQALTPSDLICGYRTNPALPETKEILDAVNATKSSVIFSDRWKFQQSLISAFWKRFRREYLVYLRSAHESKPVIRREVKPGDVVLLDDPASSRSYWPLAVVQSLSGGEGTDGIKRTCKIRLVSGKKRRRVVELERPIQLLYPLNTTDY